MVNRSFIYDQLMGLNLSIVNKERCCYVYSSIPKTNLMLENVYNGCDVRATIISDWLFENGIVCGKIFLGNNQPNEIIIHEVCFGSICWDNHVAAVVLLDHNEIAVLDPRLSNEIILFEDWIGQLLAVDNSDVGWINCTNRYSVQNKTRFDHKIDYSIADLNYIKNSLKEHKYKINKNKLIC